MLIREMHSEMPVRYPIHVLEWLKLGKKRTYSGPIGLKVQEILANL